MSMTPSLGVACLASALTCCFLLLHRRWLRLSRIPMPPVPSVVWGHDRYIYEKSAGEAYSEWFNQFGLMLKLRGSLMHPDILVAGDPDAVTHIMQTHIYDYHHSKVVRPRIERLLGRSLGWVEGEKEHKRMRHLVAPALSVDNIKKMTGDIYTVASNITSELSQHLLSSGGRSVENVQYWTGRATLDITGRASFDHDFSGGDSPEAKTILGAWRRMAHVGMQFRGFVMLQLLRRFPFLNYVPIKANKAHSDVKLTIHRGVAKELIGRDEDKPDTANENGNETASLKEKDLLSVLLRAKQNGKISDGELKDHISMFLMAGFETTSQTLSFTLWELAKHPEKQARLRQEILDFGPHEPTYDDLQAEKLPYLDAVTKEGLRLHPGLPYMERVATKDDVLPLSQPLVLSDGTTTREVPIKKGQIIVIPITAIHRLKSVWGDGATTFKPERWLAGEHGEEMPDKERLSKGWGGLLAFSEGPRNCVGFRLGELFNLFICLSEQTTKIAS